MVENYTKDLKEGIYHSAVISILEIGYTMLGKTLIVAISDFTKDYLIKQKIIPNII